MKRIDPATGDALQRVDSGGERFLSRWSRLKRASREVAPAAPASDDSDSRREESVPAPVGATTAVAPAAAQPPARDEVVAALPPVESLTIDSDYSAFFQPKVPESLRRAAVKKLFADPRFNVMDGLDTYIDDYTKPDPIPEAMLRSLNHAQGFFAPVPDPLETHRRDIAAQAQAESAPAGDAKAIEQADPAALAGSAAAVDTAPTSDAVVALAGSTEAGTERAMDADALPAPGTDPSPMAIDSTPASGERK
jgi:hypothetical protein